MNKYLGAWLALAAGGSLIFDAVGLRPTLVPLVCFLGYVVQAAAIRHREDSEAQRLALEAAEAERARWEATAIGQFSTAMNKMSSDLGLIMAGKSPRVTQRRHE